MRAAADELLLFACVLSFSFTGETPLEMHVLLPGGFFASEHCAVFPRAC